MAVPLAMKSGFTTRAAFLERLGSGAFSTLEGYPALDEDDLDEEALKQQKGHMSNVSYVSMGDLSSQEAPRIDIQSSFGPAWSTPLHSSLLRHLFR
jgi:hypothetical protein